MTEETIIIENLDQLAEALSVYNEDKVTEEELVKRIGHTLYCRTMAGVSLTHGRTNGREFVQVTSIVEGCDAEVYGTVIDFPFTQAEFEQSVMYVDGEASRIWEEVHEDIFEPEVSFSDAEVIEQADTWEQLGLTGYGHSQFVGEVTDPSLINEDIADRFARHLSLQDDEPPDIDDDRFLDPYAGQELLDIPDDFINDDELMAGGWHDLD